MTLDGDINRLAIELQDMVVAGDLDVAGGHLLRLRDAISGDSHKRLIVGQSAVADEPFLMHRIISRDTPDFFSSTYMLGPRACRNSRNALAAACRCARFSRRFYGCPVRWTWSVTRILVWFNFS